MAGEGSVALYFLAEERRGEFDGWRADRALTPINAAAVGTLTLVSVCRPRRRYMAAPSVSSSWYDASKTARMSAEAS